jgi:FixJ family two-component response regulator
VTAHSSIIYILDDDARVRDALIACLTSVGRCALAFASASEFMAFPRPNLSGCLILDPQMPDMSGFQLQEKLLPGNGPPIIFLTGCGGIPASVKAMKAGAVEFLAKPFEQRELLRAIDEAIENDRRSKAQDEEIRSLRSRYELLTPRERETFLYVVRGLPNKLTADGMGLSEIMVRIPRQHYEEDGSGVVARACRHGHPSKDSLTPYKAIGLETYRMIACRLVVAMRLLHRRSGACTVRIRPGQLPLLMMTVVYVSHWLTY